MTAPGSERLDELEAQLGDVLLLAEAGEFEQAATLLEVHDAAVRRYARAAGAGQAGPLRALFEAQRRVLERLLALRGDAANAYGAFARERRSVAAYEAAG